MKKRKTGESWEALNGQARGKKTQDSFTKKHIICYKDRFWLQINNTKDR